MPSLLAAFLFQYYYLSIYLTALTTYKLNIQTIPSPSPVRQQDKNLVSCLSYHEVSRVQTAGGWRLNQSGGKRVQSQDLVRRQIISELIET